MQEKDQNIIATIEGRNPSWRTKRGDIPMKDMDDDHLQKAKLICQKNILELHKKMCIFVQLEEQLETEAAKRKLTLKDMDELKKTGKFFDNTRKFKKKDFQPVKDKWNALNK